MNAGKLILEPETLATWLGLPSGNRITGVQWNPIAHTIQIRVEGPNMPTYGPGEHIPEINPTWVKEQTP